MAGHANKTEIGRRAGEGSRAERVFWGQVANVDQLSAAAVGANPWLAWSGLISSFTFGLVELRRRWRAAIELEDETSLSGLRSLCGMPEAEIANLVEALGENML